MNYLADLHIHSPFSRATSKAGDLPGLYAWARVKGIQVLGTGDFTHPGWYRQLKELLEPAEPGLFRLKNEKVPAALPGVSSQDIPVRFLLSAEISSIYKRHERVRKVHNLLYVPDFASAERINAKLAGIGNIESDGRPILGLDSRDLLEILLQEAPEGFLVPAHIWTPWFSLFGSRSGFDAIEECFGDLAGHIFALETGLSSDPEMNRLISALDDFALISNSDCHSPAKLGREANLFAAEFSYFGIRDALKNPGTGGFAGTIEFFPEEGKYHCDGHRKCNVCLEPLQTRELAGACPVCRRPLTVGVLHRVMELADREVPSLPAAAPAVHSLIPLPEVLGEILGSGPATKGVMEQYGRLVDHFGSEFNLTLHAPIEEINRLSPVVGEAVRRIRQGKVIRQPGFDGEFGVIRVFEEGELAALSGQISLFTGKKPRKPKPEGRKPPLTGPKKSPDRSSPEFRKKTNNPEQDKAVSSGSLHTVVSAGPGTGKTYTLIRRVVHLLDLEKAAPEKCAVITFTNRAADEIRERLTREVGSPGEKIFVGTFHRFCLEWLRKPQPDLQVLSEEGRSLLLKQDFGDLSPPERQALEKEIDTYLFQLATVEIPEQEPGAGVQRYLQAVRQAGMIELEMIIPLLVRKLRDDDEFRTEIGAAVRFLLVDEFQDLNRSQFELVEKIADLGGRIFAIGDPDQAIYGFRGSDFRFFARLGEAPETEALRLRTNYRSAPEILKAATALIGHNRHARQRADLLPTSGERGMITWLQAPTPEAEAEQVVKKIEETVGGISHFSLQTGRGGTAQSERSFADIAVLYRLSSQAEALTHALDRRGIPCQLVGALPFYLRPEVRAAHYFLQLTGAEAALADFLAMLREVSGIGQATLALLEKALPLHGRDFYATALNLPLPAGALTIIGKLREESGRLTNRHSEPEIAGGLRSTLPLLNIDPQTPGPRRLLELAGAFGSNLAAFVEHLARNARGSVYDDRAEAVPLMTMHAAKGLEFPVVFITGLEEGIIPWVHGSQPEEVEEERRLLYVAMTRAKQILHLSSAASRTIFGRSCQQQPSRFLREIPGELMVEKTAFSGSKKKAAALQMKLF